MLKNFFKSENKWTNGKKIVGKIVAIIRIEPKVLKLGKKGSCHGKERSNSWFVPQPFAVLIQKVLRSKIALNRS